MLMIGSESLTYYCTLFETLLCSSQTLANPFHDTMDYNVYAVFSSELS